MTSKETHNLISSNKVENTKVYDAQGDHIGHIDKLMIEKRSGRITYAVLRFGDVFGLGGDTYPLPWEKLDYNEELDGYHVNVKKEEVENAPLTPGETDEDWTSERGHSIYSHYGVEPYWGLMHFR